MTRKIQNRVKKFRIKKKIWTRHIRIKPRRIKRILDSKIITKYQPKILSRLIFLRKLLSKVVGSNCLLSLRSSN